MWWCPQLVCENNEQVLTAAACNSFGSRTPNSPLFGKTRNEEQHMKINVVLGMRCVLGFLTRILSLLLWPQHWCLVLEPSHDKHHWTQLDNLRSEVRKEPNVFDKVLLQNSYARKESPQKDEKIQNAAVSLPGACSQTQSQGCFSFKASSTSPCRLVPVSSHTPTRPFQSVDSTTTARPTISKIIAAYSVAVSAFHIL